VPQGIRLFVKFALKIFDFVKTLMHDDALIDNRLINTIINLLAAHKFPFLQRKSFAHRVFMKDANASVVLRYFHSKLLFLHIQLAASHGTISKSRESIKDALPIAPESGARLVGTRLVTRAAIHRNQDNMFFT
jgi:hypothetical protein